MLIVMDMIADQGVLPSARHSTAGIQLQRAPRPAEVDHEPKVFTKFAKQERILIHMFFRYFQTVTTLNFTNVNSTELMQIVGCGTHTSLTISDTEGAEGEG